MNTHAKRCLKKLTHIALLVVTIILLLVTSSAPPKTSARAACSVWRVRVRYYTDATMTHNCGTKLYLCDGTVTQTGSQSDYTTIEECTCVEPSE